MKKCSLLFVLLFWSCTPTPQQTTLRWSGSGPKPDLDQWINSSNSSAIYQSNSEDIQTYQQNLAGFKIEGSFIKTIKNKTGDTVFQSGKVVKGLSPVLSLQAFRLEQKKEKIWKNFLKLNPQVSAERMISPLEVIILTEPQAEPVIYTVLENKLGLFHALTISTKNELIKDEVVGSHLTDLIESMSTAYTRGPKKSTLGAIVLNRKNQSEILSDSNFEMFSAAPVKINLLEPLEFSVTDDRFDLVQAFYYSQQIMNWFRDELKQSYLGKLKVTTQLGFPDKTNAAFYFQNQIRLGQGDNETYSHIAWDPSIVMHETSHALIDAIAHLPFQGEGGSINEGFADVFTTFYLDSPLLGENSYLLAPFKRTVDQSMKLSEKNGGLYHDSAIVSGYFWSLRKQIGEDPTLQLAIRVLNRLGPNTTFVDFKQSLQEQSSELLSEEQNRKAHALMKERELL